MFEGDAQELEDLARNSAQAARTVHCGEDSASSEDLAQETLLAAIASPARPRSTAQLRVIARNIAISVWRRDSARDRRERSYANGRPEASVADSLPRDVERLPELLARLDSKSRRLLRLHYYEGLTLAAIAEAEGAPVATVHSRHRRALESLRRDFEAAHDPERLQRRARAAIAVPSVVRRLLEAVRALRAPMHATAVVAATLVAALWWVASSRAGESSPEEIYSAVRDSTVARAPLLSSPHLASRFDSATEPMATETTEPTEVSELEVRVIDEQGRIVSDAQVLQLVDPRKQDRTLAGTTGRHGSLVVPDDGSWLFAVHAERGASMARQVRPGQLSTLHLRLRPRTDVVRGRAVDASGAPIAGAIAEIGIGFTPRVYRDTDGTWRRTRPTPRCLTDAEGRFELRGSTKQIRRGLELRTNSLSARVIRSGGGDLGDIVLEPTVPEAPRRIRIEDSAGEPMEGVRVHIEREPAATQPPVALANGWCATHSSHAVGKHGGCSLPTGLPDHARVLVATDDGLRRILAEATLSELGDTLVVPDSSSTPTGRISGWLEEGVDGFLMSDQLALPVRIEPDAFGAFELSRVPAGAFLLRGFGSDGSVLRGPEETVEPGGHVGGLRLTDGAYNALDLRIDADLGPGETATVMIFRPNGPMMRLRSAEHGTQQDQYLTRVGLGRALIRTPGRHFVRCTIGDREAFTALDVEAVDGRQHSLVLRPVEQKWHSVVLEGLPSQIPTRAKFTDHDGNVIWLRPMQLDADRFRIPVFDGWTLRTEDQRGRVQHFAATAAEIASVGSEPLRLHALPGPEPQPAEPDRGR